MNQDKYKEIIEKAKYCLHCKNKPCSKACPLSNNIPEFIEQLKNENIEEAFKILSATTIFEPICGRICPHESQCEGGCVRGIKGQCVAIGELESFVGDYILEGNVGGAPLGDPLIKINEINRNKKIAVIGSGPAGLAASYILSNNGYKVDIYEKHSKLGGLLRYGIPEFRLDKKLLDNWLETFILNDNIRIYNNKELGKDFNIEDLKQKYDYIILAFGANISNKMNIPGEEKDFVYGGNELLEYKDMPDFKGKDVIINGGGNVAIDSAREIKKLGAKNVIIVYRRSKIEMPAERKEIKEAEKEGIEFLFKTNILEILDNKIECIKTELIQKEGENRKAPVNIEGSEFSLDVDYIVMAIGSHPNTKVIDSLELKTNKWGYLEIDENYKTSDNKIYAVGDLTGARQTVAWAARSGFECAKQIINDTH